jgi:DNA-binding transcriptional ArsR family regulator
MVWRRERTAGEIAQAFDLTFGAVSQHLGVLRDAGFVSVRKDGNHRWYRAQPERLGELAPMLERMWSESLDRLVDAVADDERSRRGKRKKEEHGARRRPR